ncbi:MAG: DUF5615 family PIN-like protein, partial [Actinomycetota bacterium]|nr:DUF5615 family PIN-like protein [Actinomycetota bacterium]
MDEPPETAVIFVDECLPLRQFRTFFENRGYIVYGVGEGFPRGAPDQAVLAAADAQAAIVVSSDTDWRKLLTTVGEGQQGRYKRAHRILFNCDHAIAINRLEALFDDVEREYATAIASGRRLIMRITTSAFT